MRECRGELSSCFLLSGSISEKKCRRYKTAQETRTVRSPVGPADHNISVSPAPQTFPLTSKRTLEKQHQNGQPQTASSAPPVGASVSANPAQASQNKKRETALTTPTPSKGQAQDQKKPQVSGGWSIQVSCHKEPKYGAPTCRGNSGDEAILPPSTG